MVLDHLDRHRLLLVLDNCEHLLAACAGFAADVLDRTADAAVLATSRQALSLAGERVFVVPPLPLPDDGVPHTELAACDSVRLFAERAGSVWPSFRITEDNAPDLVRLCRRLDGLPLAIELAAARVRSLTPRQIVDRMGASPTLLVSRTRTGPQRQQTLRGAIEWSHGLCSPAEQALWGRCRSSRDRSTSTPPSSCAPTSTASPPWSTACWRSPCCCAPTTAATACWSRCASSAPTSSPAPATGPRSSAGTATGSRGSSSPPTPRGSARRRGRGSSACAASTPTSGPLWTGRSPNPARRARRCGWPRWSRSTGCCTAPWPRPGCGCAARSPPRPRPPGPGARRRGRRLPRGLAGRRVRRTGPRGRAGRR
ncbi:ATP-binding protein [Actinokineospora soli]|uniref:ATP-binding protein n=1 Tax=Actinokineospora soli TaxID=1048753 RepID=A0ABW2TJT1_9PSEU